MSRNGLLIEYEYCNACYSCVVACKQEHNYPPGKGGIIINEVETELPDKVRIDYIPFLTEYCNLCASRTAKGEQPTCVKHCQSACMMYGVVDELAKAAEGMTKSVIYVR